MSHRPGRAPHPLADLRWIVALALAGCVSAEVEPPPAIDDPPCPSGQILDGEACVPERCGLGPWGDLDHDEDTVHVAGWGETDGDGSEDRPLRQIAPAIELAVSEERSAIVVAGGDYDGHLVLAEETAGLSLRGRCSDLVVLHATDPSRAAIRVQDDADLTAAGLAMRGESQGVLVDGGAFGRTAFQGDDLVVEGCVGTAFSASGASARLLLGSVVVRACHSTPQGTAVGVWADGGRTIIRGLEIDDMRGFGVIATGQGTELELYDTAIANVEPGPAGDGGLGMVVAGGATATAERMSLVDLAGAGVLVDGAGSQLTAADVSVDGVVHAAGGLGSGVGVQEGGSLVVDGLVIRNVEYSGIEGSTGALLDVRNAIIEDVRPGEDGFNGMGVALWGGASLTGDTIEVARTVIGGLRAQGGTTTADVANLVVRDVVPSDLGIAHAVQISGGASLLASDLLVEDSPDSGVVVFEGSSAVLERPTVRDTRPGPNPKNASGCFTVQGAGASLIATDLLAERCSGVGILAQTGGRLEVRGGLVSAPREDLVSGGRGATIQQGSTLVAVDLVVQGHREIGILVGGGSSFELERVTVQDASSERGPQGGIGIQVVLDSTMVGTDLVLQRNGSTGLQVAASTVTLDGLTATDTRRSAGDDSAMSLVVHQGGALTAQRVRLEDNDSLAAIVTGQGSRLELSDGTIRNVTTTADGSGGYALQAVDGGTAVLEELQLSDLHNFAVFVDAGHLEMRDVIIERVDRGNQPSGGVAVVVQRDSSADLEGTTLRDIAGPAIYLFDAELHCTDCTVQRTEFAGIATLGGVLVFEGGLVEDVAASNDLGGGVGLFAWHNPALPVLTFTDTVFRGTVGPAVYLRGTGLYDFDGVVMTDPAAPALAPGMMAIEGVRAWAGNTGLRLQGGEISGFGHVGLLLEASGASLDGVVFSDLAGVDVFRQHCEDTLPLDILSGSPTVQACDATPYDTEPALAYQIELLDFLEVEP